MTKRGRTRSLASLSPAYRKRIERAQAKGKTRQEARGHKPGEARERRERERADEGVAGSDRAAIRSFLARFNPYGFKDIPDEETLTDWVRENGYEAFRSYRSEWDRIRRKYLATDHASQGSLAWLEGVADGLGVESVQWLYYH